jgi:hypothetical protein
MRDTRDTRDTPNTGVKQRTFSLHYHSKKTTVRDAKLKVRTTPFGAGTQYYSSGFLQLCSVPSMRFIGSRSRGHDSVRFPTEN